MSRHETDKVVFAEADGYVHPTTPSADDEVKTLKTDRR